MLENFEERLTALEERMDLESGLRASIDRDLSALAQGQRAANHLLQALAITQAEHTQVLDRHTTMFATIDGRLETVDGRLETVDGRLETVDGKLDRIIGLLGRH